MEIRDIVRDIPKVQVSNKEVMHFNYSIIKITQTEFKNMPNFNITYGQTDSKFGTCVMGLNEDSFCFVYFGDFNTGFQELRENFPTANLSLNDALVRRKAQLFDTKASGDIKLLLKGTDFEMKVWEHLAYLPRGKTTNYSEVANGIGSPKSTRAVANAIAKNKIAYFVPCHLVISKNGSLNNFKWGPERKRKMILQEKEIAKKKLLDLFLRKPKAREQRK